MSKCEKHNSTYEIRQMEHGKTMYVCPECEKDQVDKISKIFGTTDKTEKLKFPWFK